MPIPLPRAANTQPSHPPPSTLFRRNCKQRASMGFFDPPLAPVTPTWSIEAPSGGPYTIGLLFCIVSQVLTIPLCIVASSLKRVRPF